jgi:hypothetical protein
MTDDRNDPRDSDDASDQPRVVLEGVSRDRKTTEVGVVLQYRPADVTDAHHPERRVRIHTSVDGSGTAEDDENAESRSDSPPAPHEDGPGRPMEETPKSAVSFEEHLGVPTGWRLAPVLVGVFLGAALAALDAPAVSVLGVSAAAVATAVALASVGIDTEVTDRSLVIRRTPVALEHRVDLAGVRRCTATDRRSFLRAPFGGPTPAPGWTGHALAGHGAVELVDDRGRTVVVGTARPDEFVEAVTSGASIDRDDPSPPWSAVAGPGDGTDSD